MNQIDVLYQSGSRREVSAPVALEARVNNMSEVFLNLVDDLVIIVADQSFLTAQLQIT